MHLGTECEPSALRAKMQLSSITWGGRVEYVPQVLPKQGVPRCGERCLTWGYLRQLVSLLSACNFASLYWHFLAPGSSNPVQGILEIIGL